ncbi:MAG: hypothetical protein ACI9FN_001263 [Saprospiraceae bacterium]|jgi:hypothetical protein
MKRLLYISSFILLLSTHITAQIEISGGWDQDTIVIGDEAQFTLSIQAPQDIEIVAVGGQFLDSVYSAIATIKAQIDTSKPLIPKIADFELIDLGLWKDAGEDGTFAGEELSWTKAEAGGKILYQNTFSLRLWDPGAIIMLLPPVAYIQDGVQDQIVKEEQYSIIVAPPGGIMAQDSTGIAEIKPIIEEPVKFSDYLLYFIIIGVVLLLGLLYWWYSKYQEKKAQEILATPAPVIIPPAHKVAMNKLQDLRSQQLWQEGKVKEYQSELTYIVREYLENRYDILALESTTDEIINKYLKGLLDGEDVNSLQRILQVADLVKFAKATPDEEIHESFMNEAVRFVEKTKKTETLHIDE